MIVATGAGLAVLVGGLFGALYRIFNLEEAVIYNHRAFLRERTARIANQQTVTTLTQRLDEVQLETQQIAIEKLLIEQDYEQLEQENERLLAENNLLKQDDKQ